MSYLTRRIIRALAAPRHRLSCRAEIWESGIKELHGRTESRHESGAFLLGREWRGRREVVRFEYYDDLDPHSLDSGIVIFDGAGYGPLWQMCRDEELMVVADVHVHPGRAKQSELDRDNPMIATVGHIALIVPDYAARLPMAKDLGIYEFAGGYRWYDRSTNPKNYFYTGYWS